MKKALVISGTSTIGTEMIKQMQQEYTQIIVTGRNQKKLENDIGACEKISVKS